MKRKLVGVLTAAAILLVGGQAQAELLLYDVGTGAFQSAGASLFFGGGSLDGDVDDAVPLLGVGDGVAYLSDGTDTVGYDILTGTFLFQEPQGPLNGGSLNGSFITVNPFFGIHDDAYVLSDAPNILEYTVFGAGHLTTHGYNLFTGGDLDGLSPFPEAIGIEDGLWYGIGNDNSLIPYDVSTGTVAPDALTWIDFTGSILDGRSLIDVVDGNIDGIEFWGVSDGQIVVNHTGSSAVPEPTSMTAFLGLAGVGLLAWKRRRRT